MVNKMIRAQVIFISLALLAATESRGTLDMAALSNKIGQVAGENEQGYRQTLEANKLLAINQNLGQELGRAVSSTDTSASPATLRTEHQALVEAYIQDIKQKISSTSTWPPGQTAEVWQKSASRILDQAAGFHREALAEDGDLTSSLRLMTQVRAWTMGKKELSSLDAWTETVEAQAEAKTEKTGAPAAGGNAGNQNEPVNTPASQQPSSPATPVPAAKPSAPQGQSNPQTTALTWVSKNYAKGNLSVRHSLSGTKKTAWIGFFKVGADDRDYLSYTFLNNLTANIYDVPCPEEPGAYQFRIYADEGYTPIAVSDPVEIH
ncbi:MAG: hypothetical protein Q8O57_04155 [Kiritimatiellota bacterium]|nr:hypothetical protein [Kiritimatiellota bacterium]